METGTISIGKIDAELTEIFNNEELTKNNWYITVTLGIVGDKV